MQRKPSQLREPVQAYLDSADANLLEELAERTSQSKAEVIRQAIRRLAQDHELASRPGAGLRALTGALDAAPDVPRDLAVRHDDYLYGTAESTTPRRR